MWHFYCILRFGWHMWYSRFSDHWQYICTLGLFHSKSVAANSGKVQRNDKKNWNKVRSEFEMVVKIGQQCAEAAMNFFVILLVALEFCKWTWTLKWTRHQNQMPRFVHSVALKFFVFFPICSVYFIKYVFCFNRTFIWKEKWKRKVFFVPWEQKNVQFDSIHFKSDKSAKKVKKLLTCQSGSFCLFCLNAISDYKSLFVYYTLFKGNRKTNNESLVKPTKPIHVCIYVTMSHTLCLFAPGFRVLKPNMHTMASIVSGSILKQNRKIIV